MGTSIKISGVIMAASLFLSCGKPKDLQYVSTTNWGIEQMGSKQTTINAEVRYFNPNSFALQLKKADCDVFVEDKFLGHFELDTLLRMPAKDTFMIPVSLQTETGKLLGAGIALLKKEVKVRVNGNVKVGRSGIFMNVPLQYEGIQRIEF